MCEKTGVKRLTLVRDYKQSDDGVFSTLLDEDGNHLCFTVERTWKGNQPRVSCIPEGVYDLIPHKSPRFGHCYALDGEEQDVTIFGPSRRTHILIHVANKPSELMGCIAPGMSLGKLDGEDAVLSSRIAFDKLMKHLNGKQAELEIKRV